MKVVRRRRHHRPAVQRERRRTGRVSPACPRHPAQRRRGDEAARERQGGRGGAVRSGAEACGGAQERVIRGGEEAGRSRASINECPVDAESPSPYASARNPLDLGADQALDHAREVVIEPGFQHRPEHLAHQVLQRAGVLHQHGLRQRVESGVDCGTGLAREESRAPPRRALRLRFPNGAAKPPGPLVIFPPIHRSPRRSDLRSCGTGASHGLEALPQLERARWRHSLGSMDVAIDSVRSRMSEDCSSTPPVPLSPADVSPCPALAPGAGGDDRGRAGARASRLQRLRRRAPRTCWHRRRR